MDNNSIKLIPKRQHGEELHKGWEDYKKAKYLPDEEDDYNYRVNYEADPIGAWMNFWQPHYSDKGKKPSHPTHSTHSLINPEIGGKWKGNKIYDLSERKMYGERGDYDSESDRTLDYLGNDSQDYDVKVTFNNSNVLPNLYVTPFESWFNLKPNKQNTGFIYSDR